MSVGFVLYLLTFCLGIVVDGLCCFMIDLVVVVCLF